MSSFTYRAWDFDVTRGLHLGRRHFHFLFYVYQSRVGDGMAGTTDKTPFYTTFLFSAFTGLHSAARNHARQAIIVFQKPPCTLTWQTTCTPGLGQEQR